MRSLVATARAGESRPASITSAFARRSFRLNSNSSAVRPRLSGAVVAPAPIETKAAAAAGPLDEGAQLPIPQRRYGFRGTYRRCIVGAALQQLRDRVHVCTALWPRFRLIARPEISRGTCTQA